MDFLTHTLTDPLLVNLSKTLLHFLWQGAALALALFVILKLVDTQHSRLRYLLSMSVLGLNVVAPTLTFLHFSQKPVAIETTTTVSTIESTNASLVLSSNTELGWQTLLPVIAISWLIGVVWLSLRLIYEVHQINQLPRRGTSQVEHHIQVMFEQLIRQLNVNPITRLMASTKAEVPMVIGWLQPVVLVPASMLTGLTPAQLEMLLAHELAHVKRHDYLVNFFQTLVEVLFFFHPCVKWVSRQIRIEREYCCDDMAVDCCGNPTAYARALTNAELLRRENIPQLAMAATGGDLKKRVIRLIDQHDCTAKQSTSWMSTLVAGFTGIGLVLIFVAAPHMATAEIVKDTRFESTSFQQDDVLAILEAESTESTDPQESDALYQDTLINNILPTAEVEDVALTVLDSNESSIPDDGVNETDNVASDFDKKVEETEQANNTAREQEFILPVPSLAAEVESNTADNEEAFADSASSNDELAFETETTQQQEPSDKLIVDQVSKLNQPLAEEVQKAQERFEPVTVAPKLVRTIAPKYPEKALRQGLEAEFNVTFTVNLKGKIVDLKFEEGVDREFKKSVKLALRKWRFEAGTIDGEKQPMEITRAFSFTEPEGSEFYYITGSRLPRRR